MSINKELKQRAYNEYNKALAKGLLSKPKQCSICDKEGDVEGHHEDYAKPLSIMWLCRRCHLNQPGHFLAISRGFKLMTPKELRDILDVDPPEGLWEKIKVNLGKR